MDAHIIENENKEEQKVENEIKMPQFDELPILISLDDDERETYLVQTHDYRFAQFLAMVQNNSTLELIWRVLDEGLNDEANEETVNHLIQFCQILHFWANKSYTIDDDLIKTLKGEKIDESDSDSE